MCQVHGSDVPGYDERDLQVPDEASPNQVILGLEPRSVKEASAPPERVRGVANDQLLLHEQQSIVVGHLIGHSY